jgi:hypothetical protein
LTENIYVYLLNLPRGISEAVTPCPDGYTVYIDSKLDRDSQIRAYNHAIGHIENGDLYSDESADQIEAYAHE